MFFGGLATSEYHEVSWDKPAQLWRVINTASGEYLTDDADQPRGWNSFNGAYNMAEARNRKAA